MPNPHRRRVHVVAVRLMCERPITGTLACKLIYEAIIRGTRYHAIAEGITVRSGDVKSFKRVLAAEIRKHYAQREISNA